MSSLEAARALAIVGAILAYYVMQKTERDVINRKDPPLLCLLRRLFLGALQIALCWFALTGNILPPVVVGVAVLAVNAAVLRLRSPPPDGRFSINRALVIAGALLGLIVAAISAHACDLGQWDGDPDLRAWYQGLMQPDNPAASCCGESDAYFCDDLRMQGGKAVCTVTDDRPDGPRRRPHVPVGTVVEIPNHKLKHDSGNPTGHGIVFMSPNRYVFCYVQGGGV